MAIDAVLPACERARHGRRRRRRGGRVRRVVLALRHAISRTASGRTSPSSLAGTLGYLVGAIVGWWIGVYGGRPLLDRHGRWLHLAPEQLGRAERWFDRYDDWAVLVGRVTPVVRSFVSIPAGIFRVAVRPLHRADAHRLGDLVLRARGHRLGARLELRELPPRVPVRRDRGRCRSSRSASLYLVLRRRRRRIDWSAVPRIPLVDVKAQYAPLIPQLKERVRRGPRVGRVHPRPERQGVRARGGASTSACRTRSASRTARTRSCSCSTRSASGRATR